MGQISQSFCFYDFFYTKKEPKEIEISEDLPLSTNQMLSSETKVHFILIYTYYNHVKKTATHPQRCGE